jgi:hypothetical protein
MMFRPKNENGAATLKEPILRTMQRTKRYCPVGARTADAFRSRQPQEGQPANLGHILHLPGPVLWRNFSQLDDEGRIIV